ncbi:TPA: thymidine kinase [Candidatus Dependentiae bacterium]|nr:MAG: Thymidine kinase [candidate division TM6 bacterium GW2011_GWF2_36_131]KKQ02880.1 MAG: Thymidine kinase [candidate division TM6 bacterium GW2011_GWE2_36_25]KKQ19532.1 MAG: Thymidine kinase [candidate division TM6 bacterium GW2011_GWA2_36_9]HBR70245.1 thymidine kinase [Candidatus Dependentiae bacterium]HCU00629.1 thymidine kinase [Candidatus Dependentiae bacterium]
MANETKKRGSLEVICGSMFSGKTEELIRRLRRAQYARKNVASFKHSLDKRREIEYVSSHDGNKLSAIATDNPKLIRQFVTENTDIVGIDEVQFFSAEIVDLILELVNDGKRVIVAGFDLDFRGIPMSCMPVLLALADNVTKLKAICMRCGKEARFTQRLTNHKPAKFDDPLILIGAEECYEARCRDCYEIDKQTNYTALARKYEKQQLDA